MRQPVIQTVMKSKDKNNDGKIDFQEFVGERGKDQNKVSRCLWRNLILYSYKNGKRIDSIALYLLTDLITIYVKMQDWIVSEKERFDTDLDQNKDGSLDENEVNLYYIVHTKLV